MGIAQGMYERTPLGEVGKAYPAPGDEPLSGFQAVVLEFEAMEKAGLVEISSRHQESMTGEQYIDFIEFRRLK